MKPTLNRPNEYARIYNVLVKRRDLGRHTKDAIEEVAREAHTTPARVRRFWYLRRARSGFSNEQHLHAELMAGRLDLDAALNGLRWKRKQLDEEWERRREEEDAKIPHEVKLRKQVDDALSTLEMGVQQLAFAEEKFQGLMTLRQLAEIPGEHMAEAIPKLAEYRAILDTQLTAIDAVLAACRVTVAGEAKIVPPRQIGPSRFEDD